jgi:chemotaxis protein CheC
MAFAVSKDQQDALTELINIGIGRAAHVINQMISERVTLSVPEIKIAQLSTLWAELGLANERVSTVTMDFSGSFSGQSAIVLSSKSATNLVSALVGGDAMETEELDMLKVSTLSEVGNIIANNIVGSIANALQKRLEYNIPYYQEVTSFSEIGVNANNIGIVAKTQFQVRNLEIKGDIVLVFATDGLDKLLADVSALL